MLANMQIYTSITLQLFWRVCNESRQAPMDDKE